jgi:hypothetical protein
LIEVVARTKSRKGPPPSKEDLREVSEFIWQWRLCDSVRCRRAQACRGAPVACAARIWPLIPQDVLFFAIGQHQLKRKGVPHEEILERLAERKQAFEEWMTALVAATRGWGA